MSARRYLAVVQDPRGYPAPGEPLEAAPPGGPAQPVIHTVVRADDYEALEAENARLRDQPADGEYVRGRRDLGPRDLGLVFAELREDVARVVERRDDTNGSVADA